MRSKYENDGPAGAYKAFLTGSRAYGIPRHDSDVDLVVFLSEQDFDKLIDLADANGGELDEDYRAQGCYPLQFGKLQLLCVSSPEEYRVWLKGTRALKKKAPVPRDFAVEFFRQLREEEAEFDGQR